METTDYLVKEFRYRVFDESFVRIEKCLAVLPDASLWIAPNETTVSVGNLVLHMLGNARQWIVSGFGGAEDIRDRDWEFVSHPELSKADLRRRMNAIVAPLNAVLDGLSDNDMKELKTIQRFEVSGFSALIHVIEHFSYHTGQITLLTKLLKNEDLGYYSNYDL